MSDLLTIVTPTVGDSAARLEVLCHDMRKLTKLPFTHLVCDDGTISDDARSRQRLAAGGCLYMENPGPVYGASYALNLLMAQVRTPWALIVSDAARPSLGWLEATLDFIEKIGSRAWNGHEVGLAGFSQIPAFVLALGGAFQARRDPICYLTTPEDPIVVEDFLGDWNDGRWCWPRMRKQIVSTCIASIGSRNDGVHQFGCTFLYNLDPQGDWEDPLLPYKIRSCLNPNHWGGFWPEIRTARHFWYGGPLAAVSVEAWQKAGRFCEGCYIWEAHLAMRMALNGYLVLTVETPPWLYMNGVGAAEVNAHGKTPRPREVDELWTRDFGITSQRGPIAIDRHALPLETRRAINRALLEMPLDLVAGWETLL